MFYACERGIRARKRLQRYAKKSKYQHFTPIFCACVEYIYSLQLVGNMASTIMSPIMRYRFSHRYNKAA